MPITREVPSLKQLAAKELKKSDPLQLFRLFNYKEKYFEIYQNYIQPMFDRAREKQTNDYKAEVQKRNRKVSDCKNDLNSNHCFPKTSGLVSSVFLTLLYLGIYFLLKTNGMMDVSTQVTWIAITPVIFIVGTCLGFCCSPLLAIFLANCCTPTVSKPKEIDLEEVIVSSIIEEKLSQAIEARNTLNCTYHDKDHKTRKGVIEPYHYGILDATEQLHCYQTESQSEPEEPPQWKNFKLAEIQAVSTNRYSRFQPRDSYDPENSNYTRIEKSVDPDYSDDFFPAFTKNT
ncbi:MULTISPECIES: hypothetical protein [unclassified Legionella]|uniref:hypothetical protein n=1 Tax=unclassified Legionella TaxID=2622702 RepID=UPI001056975C|nr:MULTISPECIES: hypothetical protein [unclassified Legionella]MDI9819376.1 hypothetical protein [Legionella sp. PL877]